MVKFKRDYINGFVVLKIKICQICSIVKKFISSIWTHLKVVTLNLYCSYIYIYICMYIYICIRVYVCMHMHVCICMCMHMCVNVGTIHSWQYCCRRTLVKSCYFFISFDLCIIYTFYLLLSMVSYAIFPTFLFLCFFLLR